jgi:hypothetical protein
MRRSLKLLLCLIGIYLTIITLVDSFWVALIHFVVIIVGLLILGFFYLLIYGALLENDPEDPFDKLEEYLKNFSENSYSMKIHRKGNKLGEKNPKFFIDFWENLIHLNLKDKKKRIVRQIPIEELVIININPFANKFYVWNDDNYSREGLTKEFAPDDIKIVEDVTRINIDSSQFKSSGIRERVFIEYLNKTKNHNFIWGIASDSFEELRMAIQDILSLMLKYPEVEQYPWNFVHFNIVIPGVNDQEEDKLLTYKTTIPVRLYTPNTPGGYTLALLGQIQNFSRENGLMSFYICEYNPEFGFIKDDETQADYGNYMATHYEYVTNISRIYPENEKEDEEENLLLKEQQINNSLSNVIYMTPPKN